MTDVVIVGEREKRLVGMITLLAGSTVTTPVPVAGELVRENWDPV